MIRFGILSAGQVHVLFFAFRGREWCWRLPETVESPSRLGAGKWSW